MTDPLTPAQREQVTQFQRDLAAMLDPQDIPGSWTPREREAYDVRRHVLATRVRYIGLQLETLAATDPRIADDTAYRTTLTTVRQTGADMLLACPPRPRTDLERGVIRNLELSLQVLDRGVQVLADTGWILQTTEAGKLLLATGVGWHGSLPDVEHRLGDLRARRDDALHRIATALAEPVPVAS